MDEAKPQRANQIPGVLQPAAYRLAVGANSNASSLITGHESNESTISTGGNAATAPRVAANSTVRVRYGRYTGTRYQVQRA